jgi:peptidoglycan hydrolase-like protein with peptidoglycan-binding domain
MWWPWWRRVRLLDCNGARMNRRWLIVGVLAIGAAAAGVTMATRRPTTAEDGAPDTTVPRETSKVTRTDLVEEEKLSGTLGYGDSKVIGSGGTGTITALPDPGTVLKQGDSPWQVDGHAGPAVFYGDLPLWRPLRAGVDDGADVAEVEQNLTDLGFGADLTVDDEFDKHTTTAIKAWQDSRGFKKTGVVDPADVVVEKGPVRVAEQRAAVGDPVSREIISVTGAAQVVTLDVALDKVDLLSAGAAVEVELPDDSRVPGTVATIGRAATVKQEGSAATVAASVSLQSPVASLDAAPVDVVLSTPKATGVLVVPIRALVALAEGGYAVEKVSGASTQLVAVKPGAFGDGVVEVTGTGLAEGDTVVVAP